MYFFFLFYIPLSTLYSTFLRARLLNCLLFPLFPFSLSFTPTQLDTSSELEAWVTVLSSTSSRMRKRRQQMGYNSSIAGWVCKVKHGFPRQRWLALVGCVIFYGPSENAAHRGHIHLASARLALHNAEDESDPEDSDADGAASRTPMLAKSSGGKLLSPTAASPTPSSSGFAVFRGTSVDSAMPHPARPAHALEVATPKGHYNLLFGERRERDRWAHYCAAVTGESLTGLGTAFERAMRRIVSDARPRRGTADERRLHRQTAALFPAGDVFALPALRPLASPHERQQPLTTLPDATLDQAASKLHKDVHLFVTVLQPPEAEQLAYHVKLAQSLTERALVQPELRDELLATLIAETNVEGSASPAAASSARQAWQLLALVCPLFTPSKTLSRCCGAGRGVLKQAEH